MNTDRNLLFGALAFQNEYIDLAQFAAACRAWAADKSRPLADLLVERGWINAAVAAMIDEIVERKLKRYGGDAHATLGAVADGQIRHAIREVSDPDISHSVSTLPPAAGHVLVEAVTKPGDARTRYTLSRLHAEGGIGRVWLARDADLNRDVALKELKPNQATHPDAWRRFMKEAQITGQLEHPNIVPVYELARRPGDDQPFYTMRFVRGQTLRDAIREYHERRHGPFVVPPLGGFPPLVVPPLGGTPGQPTPQTPPEGGTTNPPPEGGTTNLELEFRRLLRAFISVCHAIAYAHSRGVVHRDLKPANVVLGGFGEVLVLDWGIAKVAGATDAEAATLGFSDEAQTTATQTGALLGTPEYMAPEQAEGRAELIDARTDIYGLGGILFAIVTGQAPRRGKDTIEVISQLLDNPTPQVRSVAPHAPAALDAICAKAMAKDPADRYASASELAAEVERYLADEPVLAYREPLSARLGRWSRRHRTGTQAAAVILLAVTLLSVLATVLVNEQRHRADSKHRESRRHLYVAHMNLAQKAWEETHMQRLIDLLDLQFVTQAGDTDLRGFEWYYWRRLCNSELLVLESGGNVDSVIFSPDGRRLAAVCREQVNVWDAATGREIITLAGHGNYLYSVVFSPDGKHLACGSDDHTVIVWDAATGRETHTLKGHEDSVQCVAYSPNGKRLASGSFDDTVRLWDLDTDREILTLNRHTSSVSSVAFSPDGKRLASVDGTVRVWETTTGREILTITIEPHDLIECVVFNPTGDSLATGSAGGAVKLWDTATGQVIQSLEEATSLVRNLAFSPDGSRLTAAGNDPLLAVWEVATGKKIITFKHAWPVESVAFSPDGRRLASGSVDVKVWDAHLAQENITLSGHDRAVHGVAFSPDNKRLASGSEDGTVKIWDSETGQQIVTLTGQFHRVYCVAFGPDGKRLASGTERGTVEIWDLATNREILTLGGHSTKVDSVAFSPDGKRLASCSGDLFKPGELLVWDLDTGQELLALGGEAGAVSGATFSPDGKRVASGCKDWTVKVWDLATGQVTITTAKSNAFIECVRFSPDGKRLAGSTHGGTVKIWDVATGGEVLTLEGHSEHYVWATVFSPDGRRLASAGADNTVKVWDSATGLETLTLTGHTNDVLNVAFSPDGFRLASAGADGTVKIWDARPWTPELKAEQEALGLLRFLCLKLPAKERLIERIRGDATISEPVRRRALELAETFWERHMAAEARE